MLLSLFFFQWLFEQKRFSPLNREGQFYATVLNFQEPNHSNLESERMFFFFRTPFFVRNSNRPRFLQVMYPTGPGKALVTIIEERVAEPRKTNFWCQTKSLEDSRCFIFVWDFPHFVIASDIYLFIYLCTRAQRLSRGFYMACRLGSTSNREDVFVLRPH